MNHRPIRIVCFVGRGGCGKDTQVKLLTERHIHSIRISSGDLIRAAHDQKNKYHEIIKPYEKRAEEGRLIPISIVLKLVEHEIAELILKGYKDFYLTGFPRSLAQLALFDEWSAGLQAGLQILHTKLDTIFIELAISEKHSRQRAQIRIDQAKKTGEPIRKDDSPEVVEKRLQEYSEMTEPMIRSLEKEKRLISIKAKGEIEKIHEKINKSLHS